MIITSQGFGHFTNGMNNQDFGIENSRMLLVLDGCSGAKYSEVGTRLFAQLFSRKEECNKVEKFEENVKKVFEEMLEMFKKQYANSKDFEQNFIMENLLFTIIGCFNEKDKYTVKLFGDGYIITQNLYGSISYVKLSYGKYPPYYAYKYCSSTYEQYKNYEFKTFKFNKDCFKNVGIATDGIMPIVKGETTNIDEFIVENKDVSIATVLQSERQVFFDDVTIGLFGGKV